MGVLGGALSLAGEPQLAVRMGEVFVPRLVRAAAVGTPTGDDGAAGVDAAGIWRSMAGARCW